MKQRLRMAGVMAFLGFTLSVWHSGNTLIREERPRTPAQWRCGDFDAAASPDQTLDAFAGKFFSRGLRIAVTDLLWQGAPEHFLDRFGAGAGRTVVISPQPPSPGEMLEGDARLVDAESGETRTIELDETARSRFRARLARHRELWDRAAAARGVTLLRPALPPEPAEWDLEPFFRAGLLQ